MAMPEASDCTEADLIARFQADPQNEQLTTQVISRFKWLVWSVARRVHSRINDVMFGIEDLVPPGQLALLTAARTYDPTLGEFRAMARVVVYRSMINELRSANLATKSAIKFSRSLVQAQERLSHRLGREPSTSEIAAELGMSEEKLITAYCALDKRPLSLELPIPEQGLPLDEFLPSNDDVEGAVVARDQLHWVFRTVAGWDEERRMIFYLAYVQGQTRASIGRRLGVTESRISQRLTKMAGDLRRQQVKESPGERPSVQLAQLRKNWQDTISRV